MKTFLKRLKKIPRLTDKEFVDLLARKTELEARNKLVESFLPLVVNIARKYALTLDLDDLISEGSLGLLKAIEKFDNRLNKSFVRYAKMWINGYIYRFVHKNVNIVINNPLRESTNFEKTTITMGLLEEYAGYTETDQELINSRLALKHLLTILAPRVRKMIECKYNNENPQTFVQIGAMFKTSKQNVQDRILVAIKRMRQDYERELRDISG